MTVCNLFNNTVCFFGTQIIDILTCFKQKLHKKYYSGELRVLRDVNSRGLSDDISLVFVRKQGCIDSDYTDAGVYVNLTLVYSVRSINSLFCAWIQSIEMNFLENVFLKGVHIPLW